MVTQYEEVEKLARDYNAVVVFNTQARKGQSFSIRLGIERSTADQAMLCVADQPYLRLNTFKKLLELADGEHIICVTCQGILRNPAIFPRKYYKELLALADEQGGKQILKKYREKVIAVPCDVDEVRDRIVKKESHGGWELLGKKLNPQLFIDFLLYENKQSLYKIYSFSGSCLWM